MALPTFVSRVEITTTSSTDNLTTAAFVTSGSNRALFVLPALRATSVSISSIVRGGSDAFSNSGVSQDPSGVFVNMWASTNEPVAASTALATTLSAAVTVWGVHVIVMSDVDQTTRFEGAVVNADTDATDGLTNLTVASGSTNNMVMDYFALRANSGTPTVAGSQTDRGGWLANNLHSRVSTLPGTGGNVSMGWGNISSPADFIAHMGWAVRGIAATVPDAPTSLTVSNVGGTQLGLSWTAPASDGGSAITGYKIERESPTGGGFSTLVADTGDTSTTYTDTGLSLNTQYNYKISAINAIGTGSASTAAAKTTPTALLFNITLPTDLSEFTDTPTGAGNSLARNATAGINDDPGVRITMAANTNTYAYYTLPVPLVFGSDTGFNLGFHGGPTLASLSMATDDLVYIVRVRGAADAGRLGIRLGNIGAVRTLAPYVVLDEETIIGDAVSIQSSQPEWIDLVVTPSSSGGAFDGSIEMFFDGVSVSLMEFLDISVFDYAQVQFGFPSIATTGGTITGVLDMGPFRAYRDTTQAISPNPFAEILFPPGDVLIGVGESVYFEGTASVGFGGSTIDSHLWTFGSGSGIANFTSEVPNEQVFNNSGIFTVSYVATDNNGLISRNGTVRTIRVGLGVENQSRFFLIF